MAEDTIELKELKEILEVDQVYFIDEQLIRVLEHKEGNELMRGYIIIQSMLRKEHISSLPRKDIIGDPMIKKVEFPYSKSTINHIEGMIEIMLGEILGEGKTLHVKLEDYDGGRIK